MIELGTHVEATEIAYVARKSLGQDKRWYIPVKGNFEAPHIGLDGYNIFIEGLLPKRKGRFLHEIPKEINKGVISFPCHPVSGVVIGLETKHYGRSEPQSSGYDSYTGEWDDDPGGFTYYGKIDLYVVKSELRGKAFYVPESALTVLPDQT